MKEVFKKVITKSRREWTIFVCMGLKITETEDLILLKIQNKDLKTFAQLKELYEKMI